MSIRRVALRCINAGELSPEEQQTFADDVKGRIEETGADLGGYMITCGGNNWIELEGDEDAVGDVIDAHKSDSRVDSVTELEDVNPSSTNTGQWRSHTESDLHNEVT